MTVRTKFNYFYKRNLDKRNSDKRNSDKQNLNNRPKTSLSKVVEAFACLPVVVGSELPPIRLETKTMLESSGNSYSKFCSRKMGK